MPKRNTEIPEVLIGQFGQNVSVDLVFTKNGFVLTQAETAQPSPDIHLWQSPSRADAMMGLGSVLSRTLEGPERPINTALVPPMATPG